MVELGIQVKLSARQLTPDEAMKKISKVRTGMKVAAAFFSAVGIFHTINKVYADPEIAQDPANWHHVVDVTIFPCELLLISISLVSAYLYLSYNIEQHFAKELKNEGKKIKGIFVLISLAYISRGFVYLLMQFEVIEHNLAVYHIMYLFWDVLPLSAIMIYHLKAFRVEEKEPKESPVDWTRQSSTTSGTAPVDWTRQSSTTSGTAQTDSKAQSESQGVPKFELTPSSAKSMLINSDDFEGYSVLDQEKRAENSRSQSLVESTESADLATIRQSEIIKVRP